MTVGCFEKVSFDQFLGAMKDVCCFQSNTDEAETDFRSLMQTCYDELALPTRATAGSAGYDFDAPFDFEIESGQSIKIPTGIRAKMQDGWFLAIVPRSGLGFKYKLRLANTVGIIDQDYYYSDNEGHIFVKLCNEGDKTVSIKSGSGIVQGIFLPYGLCDYDDVTSVRNGGFGSTD